MHQLRLRQGAVDAPHSQQASSLAMLSGPPQDVSYVQEYALELDYLRRGGRSVARPVTEME